MHVANTLSPTLVVQLTDLWAAGSLKVIGGLSSTYGFGDNTLTDGSNYGVQQAFQTSLDLVMATMNFSEVVASNLATRLNALIASSPWQVQVPQLYSGIISILSGYAGQLGLTGVTNLASFATYYNGGVGGYNQCLFCPEFLQLWNICNPSVALGALNVYSPAIANMGTITVSPFGIVTGSTVNTTFYAGAGQAQVVMSGIAGTPPGVITVLGTNQNGVTGHSWNATITGNGTFTLVPVTTGDLLTAATGAVGSALSGISGGTIVIQAVAPAGRTDPPNV
jgi:hypothetical protein